MGGFELAVALQHHPVAQAVLNQGLLGFGKPEFPGQAAVADGGQWRGAGAAHLTANQDHVGPGFGHAGGNRAHPHFGNQFNIDAGLGVGAFEVVDQLGQVLDGINVVVGRRRYEPHVGGAVAGGGDPGIDLFTGQLAAFAGFGPLGHLDLEFHGAGEVCDGHAEAA